jgi:hypothetical protein
MILLVSAVVSIVLTGCRDKSNLTKWCALNASSAADGGSGETKKYSLLFEEEKGILFAKILKCGSDEYYLGDNVAASSDEVVEKAKINVLKWSGSLTCLNAIQAYPEDSVKTMKALQEICKQEESTKDSKTSNPPTRNTEL